ncbi:MAG: transposase [Nostoc sp.]|uniref:RNA-guided endonuclease InsQ/TnpB family protein n=1 Tax=Nostoc sp. TaxID=1180 RepID=UPI002FFBF014
MFAIKRELKLNNVETSLMRGNAGFKRLVYNYGLDLIQSSWDFEDIKASDSKRLDAIKKVFTQVTMHKPEYAWMRLYPSTVYQSAFIDLKKAFERWRKGISGFPKKKSKKKGDSFSVYKTAGIYPEKGKLPLAFTNRVVIKSGKEIKLPGLKTFRLKERIDFTCSSQTFTVSRTADKWFVAFMLDAEKLPPIIHPIEKIGVDLGVKVLATCSDGTKYDMPITTKTAKTKLGKLQWRNRSKVQGNKKLKIKASNNAKKYYTCLSRYHARIANIRQDTIQKMTTDLSHKAYVIRIEDLNVQGMIANQKLAQAVTNNCFYEIRRQLIYKQSPYGTKVELVDRWYPSSKMCSNCGHIQPMGLSERVYNCGKCNNIQDRDQNAANNLRDAPQGKIRLA